MKVGKYNSQPNAFQWNVLCGRLSNVSVFELFSLNVGDRTPFNSKTTLQNISFFEIPNLCRIRLNCAAPLSRWSKIRLHNISFSSKTASFISLHRTNKQTNINYIPDNLRKHPIGRDFTVPILIDELGAHFCACLMQKPTHEEVVPSISDWHESHTHPHRLFTLYIIGYKLYSFFCYTLNELTNEHLLIFLLDA